MCLDLKYTAVHTGLPLVIAAQYDRQVIDEAHLRPVYIGKAGDIERIANSIVGFWNRSFADSSAKDNRIKNGRPIPSATELYCEILKGRDIGAGTSTVLAIDGNTGRLSAIEPSVDRPSA